MHTVEKIGGTSMSNYPSVRDNIICHPQHNSPYQRIMVVSAYGGMTDLLLENKRNGEPGVFAAFANGDADANWQEKLVQLRRHILTINEELFVEKELLSKANAFIEQRLNEAEQCLHGLQTLCTHGHFSLQNHLDTVREMLASIGEAHSAWNTAELLQRDGINAQFIDLTGWNTHQHMDLDERIRVAFQDTDLSNTLPIVTGYAHTEGGLMSTFARGYTEMTFSRLAVITGAREAIIHKEFHLSSADPRIVGEANVVPIGRTNYDVADQLANLGMEAIHPKAATGLRLSAIPLRVKNTFEPEHGGTLITGDYVSDEPCVEIIAGRKNIYALEVFDQNMSGNIASYDQEILKTLQRFHAQVVAKDVNANTITHFVSTNLKTVKRITKALAQRYPDAEFNQTKVAIVSAIGSDMKVPGILAKTVQTIAAEGISLLAVHQSMRQVDMQFVVAEDNYEATVKALHATLVETINHGRAICLAS